MLRNAGKIVLLFITTALILGCATAKQEYCNHDEVTIIEVQNDNYVVKCQNPTLELDPKK